jgi:hypothetical protein
MGFTWEAARWQLATAAGGMWLFFTVMNGLMVAVRFFKGRRASSIPLVGTMFGVVALIAVPVSVSWEWVLAVLGVFLAAEGLSLIWPASMIDPPEQRK